MKLRGIAVAIFQQSSQTFVASDDHEVRFEFRPWRVYVGVGTTFVTLVFVIPAIFWRFGRISDIEGSVSS